MICDAVVEPEAYVLQFSSFLCAHTSGDRLIKLAACILRVQHYTINQNLRLVYISKGRSFFKQN